MQFILTSGLYMFTAAQEEFAKIEVEYLTMPGWNCSTEHARQFSDLPPNAQSYVRKIEELMGVPGRLLWSFGFSSDVV